MLLERILTLACQLMSFSLSTTTCHLALIGWEAGMAAPPMAGSMTFPSWSPEPIA